MLEDLESADAITEQVTRLLRAADAGDRLPTPVDDIVAAAGLDQTDEILLTDSMIKRAPKEMRRLLRGARRKIAGVLDRKERVIQIADVGNDGRRRFVACHEVAHDSFPWQAELAVLGDTSATLSPQVTALFEQEANQGAAEILFQQDLLRRMARDYPIEIATPVLLAQLFGASIHATFRRWVEGINATAIGLVLAPEVVANGRKRYEHLPTAKWREQFGTGGFPQFLATPRHPFAAPDATEGTLHRMDRSGTQVELKYELVDTPYRRFVLLWLPKRESFVARHRKKPVLAVPTT